MMLATAIEMERLKAPKLRLLALKHNITGISGKKKEEIAQRLAALQKVAKEEVAALVTDTCKSAAQKAPGGGAKGRAARVANMRADLDAFFAATPVGSPQLTCRTCGHPLTKVLEIQTKQGVTLLRVSCNRHPRCQSARYDALDLHTAHSQWRELVVPKVVMEVVSLRLMGDRENMFRVSGAPRTILTNCGEL